MKNTAILPKNPVIRLLNPTLINQIAAGEVIERPAAVVKELVENAVDAGATQIEVTLREGGRTLIQVTDNGCGMTGDDLCLAIERHATSKLPDDNLFNIRSFGFRGEALPSIAAVSRLTLTSRVTDHDTGWQLVVEGGEKKDLVLVSHPIGTRVTVRDLFYATPARLKFLKTVSTELSHCVDYINRLAMAHPAIGFTLKEGERCLFDYRPHNSIEQRLGDILKSDFSGSARPIQGSRDGLQISGWISLPTYNRSQSTEQFLFVNNRPVRDKLFHAAVKFAYQDLLAHNRYPAVVLFLTIHPEEVDVNVHPAKTEVRFRDPQIVRGLIINAIKQTLAAHSQTTSPHLGGQAVAVFKTPTASSTPSRVYHPAPRISPPFANQTQRMPFSTAPAPVMLGEEMSPSSASSFVSPSAREDVQEYPLGHAVAQIHTTFILSEKADGLIIVDQHAAHERFVYEKLKQQFNDQTVPTQAVLLPEIVQLSSQDFNILQSHFATLQRLGFEIEVYGTDTLVVRQTPAILKGVNPSSIIRDLIADLKEEEPGHSVIEQIYEILSSLACRTSIRAGQKLSIAEMNALLRQMENTLHSGQCNHGRPTYVELKKSDIEKLFGRR